MAVLCIGCKNAPEKSAVTPVFYYWKSALTISSFEKTMLDSLHCHQLFVRCLDLGIDPASGEIQPVAGLETVDTAGLRDVSLVPCVYVVNAVFKKEGLDTDELARQTAAHIRRVFAEQLPGKTFDAIQVDCDWTGQTQRIYFEFLKKLNALFPDKQLTCTIRLHQYKFPTNTGVPPVDRGTLMLYNTGDIGDYYEENSIFFPGDAEKYLQNAQPYPLPLDVALPLFSWAVVYSDQSFLSILSGLTRADFSQNPHFFAESPNRFAVRTGTYLEGHYLRPGDAVRVETITPELLEAAAKLAQRVRAKELGTIAFFALDSATLARFPVQSLDSICKKTTEIWHHFP